MGTHAARRGGGRIDDTAFVEDSAYIAGTSTVGARSYLGHGVYVGPGLTVGTDVIICDRVRVITDIPNGSTVLCDCCGGGGGGGSEDMVLLASVFAFDGMIGATGDTYAAAPGTADWEVSTGIPSEGMIPVNPMTDLATVPVRVQLTIWVHDQNWDNDNLGNMTYEVRLHDGSLLGSGTYPAHSTVTGKAVLVDVSLSAGIIDNNAGVYVTWIPLEASGDGQISQRLNLVISATPPA